MTRHEELVKHGVGRPRVGIRPEQVNHLRIQGASWRHIAKELRIGTATAMRLLRVSDEACPSIQEMSPNASDQLT